MTCEFDNDLYGRLMQKAVRKLIPIGVLFELTYKCNISCCHCYIADEGKDELSTVQIKNVLDQLAEAGTLFLTLSGGEILTRDDFFKIAIYARKRKFSLRLFTNGTLITPKVADKIKELYPRAVEISLYGATQDIHESITGVPGSYNRTVNAFKLLQKRDIRTIMKTVWMKKNASEFLHLVDLSEALQAIPCFTPLICPKGNGSRDPLSLRLSDQELFQLYDSAHRLNRGVSLGRPEEQIKKEQIPTALRCNASLTHCNISPYGEVTPCNQLRQVAGNLREESFSHIWNSSPRLQYLRSLKSYTMSQCLNCQLLTYCFHCPGLALNEDGDLLTPSSELCRLARIYKEVRKSYEKEQTTVPETQNNLRRGF